METVTPEIVKQKLEKKARGPFADIIEGLPTGVALKLHPAQWAPRKEDIQHFFLTRFRGKVSVIRMEGCFYIIKK